MSERQRRRLIARSCPNRSETERVPKDVHGASDVCAIPASSCFIAAPLGHSSNGSFSRLRHGFGMARRQAVGAGTVGAAVFGGEGTVELGAAAALGISALVAEGAADATGAVEAVGSARLLVDAAPFGGPTLRHAWGDGESRSLEQLVTASPASAVAMKNARRRRISLRASSSSEVIARESIRHSTALHRARFPRRQPETSTIFVSSPARATARVPA